MVSDSEEGKGANPIFKILIGSFLLKLGITVLASSFGPLLDDQQTIADIEKVYNTTLPDYY